MAKRPSLTRQVQNTLTDKLKAGESKYSAKIEGTYTEGIYSYKTLKAYMEQANYFVKYCKENYGCRYLGECRQYADEYLRGRIDRGGSPYTLHLIRAALCKLYGDTSKDYIELPQRKRQDITRSRGEAVRDKHFSEDNHKEIVAFCRATGLRRHELAQIKGTDYTIKGDVLYIKVNRGKGGKSRQVPISDKDKAMIMNLLDKAGGGKVFPVVPGGMDVHSYRAIYASDMYTRLARPLEQIPKRERYYCRKDRRGIVLDKVAMMAVSQALGHNRISVIASHYLIPVR